MRKRTLSVPEKHMIKIAKDTMKLSCIGAKIMGGMNHLRAVNTLREHGYNVNLDPDCVCPA